LRGLRVPAGERHPAVRQAPRPPRPLARPPRDGHPRRGAVTTTLAVPEETHMKLNHVLGYPLALAGALAFTPCPAWGASGDGDAQPVTLASGDGAELSGRYFPGNEGPKSPAVL